MTVKQEQEPAQTDVVEVGKGVLRMQLPIQVPGLGHVNMYCLRDERGVAVVDPGLPTESSWNAIRERLRHADLHVSDVHTVVVTHSHPDHFGGAGRFHAETGCRVIAHHDFSVFGESLYHPHLEVSVEHLHPEPEPVPDDCVREEIVPPWLRAPEARPRVPWGGAFPELTAEQRGHWQQSRTSGISIVPRLTHTVRHGAAVTLAGRDWFVWHTPGHTTDHVCLYDPEEGIFLSGDHVPPSITPHISGTGTSPDPLQVFFDSLDRVLEVGGVARCLPAHGHPFADLAGRVVAIKRHHVERLEKIKAIGKRLGPATVQQITEQLFHPRNWGHMAESEAYAHLEHLRLRQQAECRRREDGHLVYTL